MSILSCFHLVENRIKRVKNIDNCIFCKTDPTAHLLFEQNQNTLISDVTTNIIMLELQNIPLGTLDEYLENGRHIIYNKPPTTSIIYSEYIFVDIHGNVFNILLGDSEALDGDFQFKFLFFKYDDVVNPLLFKSQLVFDISIDFPSISLNNNFTVFVEYESSNIVSDIHICNNDITIKLPNTNNVNSIFKVYFDFINDQITTYINNENHKNYATYTFTDNIIKISASRTISNQSVRVNNMGVFPGYMQDDVYVSAFGTRNNVFLGTKTGFTNTSGCSNIFMGNESGYHNKNGSHNVFIGERNGFHNTSGTDNVFIGYECGFHNVDGSNNIFLGNQCGYQNTSGNHNIFIGDKAGYNNSIGSFNLIIGNDHKQSNPSENNYQNIEYSNNDRNTIMGSFTGSNYITGNGIGANNTFIGSFSAHESNINYHNTFIGASVAIESVNTTLNTFVGSHICQTGYGNVNSIFGAYAGNHILNSNQCTHLGTYSAYNSIHSTDCISIGHKAGYTLRHAKNSICIGNESGFIQEHATDNIYIGSYAGKNNYNGSQNIFIGHSYTKDYIGNNNIIIGNVSAINGDNILSINNLITGDFESNQVNINGTLHINKKELHECIFQNCFRLKLTLQYKNQMTPIYLWTGLERINLQQISKEDDDILHCWCVPPKTSIDNIMFPIVTHDNSSRINCILHVDDMRFELIE